MQTIDPRVQRWLDNKNALTKSVLETVRFEAGRIQTAFNRGTLTSDMDAKMAMVIPALKHANESYGLDNRVYKAAEKAEHEFARQLPKPESDTFFEQLTLLREIFSDAHDFMNDRVRYLTFAYPDNSLDFIAFRTELDMQDKADIPSPELFTINKESGHSSSPRIEFSKTINALGTEAHGGEVLNMLDDWHESGIVVRKLELHPNSRYTAFYHQSYGAQGRFIETSGANTRPKLEKLTTWRT